MTEEEDPGVMLNAEAADEGAILSVSSSSLPPPFEKRCQKKTTNTWIFEEKLLEVMIHVL